MKRLSIRTILLTLALVATAAAQTDPKRAITNIAGDLYRFQNNFHYSVFLVTPDGVVVTDPINADAARWLQAEIAARFDKPIRYLVLSHDHADHSSGGEVFQTAGAIVVAHENAKAVIAGERRPTAMPDITFRDTLTLELGGKVVELYYVGQSHSDNSIVMRFPEERVLFAVDFVSVDRLPYRDLSDAYFPEWMQALRKVEALDFEILAPGHGPLGTHADVAEHRAYLDDLYAGVLAGMRAGRTLEQIKSELTLDAYKAFGQYDDWRELNIEGMYRNISLHRRGN